MKLNIQITKIQKGFLSNENEIVNIDINNGNWKYEENNWEKGKISLTINNICKAHYLHQPVKDAYPFYDKEEAKNYNLVVEDAMVREYDSLIDYLTHRINNVKENYKKYGWTEQTFNIILFDLNTKKFRDDIVADIVFEKEALCEVKISVVE